MPITIPKSILLIPKVPSMAVVVLLVAEFLLMQNLHKPDPYCTLRVDYPHYSTSLKETKGIDAIKLNVTSECSAPQRFTCITARIQKLQSNSEVTVSRFVSRIAEPISNSANSAIFRNLFTKCEFGIVTAYKGIAEGYVILENGKRIEVTGSSGKYEPANCEIGAQ